MAETGVEPQPGAGVRRPAIEGWFTDDPDDVRLIGTRCAACGTIHFPPQALGCRNPDCSGSELDSVPLSRRGRIWSYTDARYRPPPPYVSGEEFEPYAIAAVELAAERIVVLGQMERGWGVDDLAIGMEVELTTGTLYTDDEGGEHVVWKWRPVGDTAGSTA